MFERSLGFLFSFLLCFNIWPERNDFCWCWVVILDNISCDKHCTKKMKFSIKDFFSKCDQIISFLQIWSHLLKKSLMENFIFCALKVFDKFIYFIQNEFTLNLDKFKFFGRKDKLLDNFYLHVLGIQKYKELAYIIKIKWTLSYGQAAVERGFSVGKSYLECQYE